MHSFDPTAFLYYRVQLNKTNYTYKILDMFSGTRVGTGPGAASIQYWEYINPTT